MSDTAGIPTECLERNPLLTPGGYRRWREILEHPAAPPWNYATGDRVRAEDLPAVDTLRRALRADRRRGDGRLPASLADWVLSMRRRSDWFESAAPASGDLREQWSSIPTMQRADLAGNLARIVPRDAGFERLIAYETSGITGHALHLPHHPSAVAQNHALMEFVLERYGVRPDFREGTVACVNLSAHRSTVMFATVFAVWNNAGFAKVNLHPRVWSPEAARRFLADLAPSFLTGDPVGFATLLAWEVPVRPAAMISCAAALAEGLKSRLEAAFSCPVIDTYASTETGAIAYADPGGRGLSVLPTDLYVEVVDADGRPLPEGERGEICVTGGRNPYLPLLRYKTGDFARLSWSEPAEGDPAPRLFDLEARRPVMFRAADGSGVGPVDIGKVIRAWAVVSHEFVQGRDGACRLAIRPAPGGRVDPAAIERGLRALFGDETRLTVVLDETLGDDQPGGKVVPFRSEYSSQS